MIGTYHGRQPESDATLEMVESYHLHPNGEYCLTVQYLVGTPHCAIAQPLLMSPLGMKISLEEASGPNGS